MVRFRKEMSEKKTCFLFRSSAAKEAFALAKADLHSALPMKETSKEKMLAFFLSSLRPLERYFCLTKISYHKNKLQRS